MSPSINIFLHMYACISEWESFHNAHTNMHTHANHLQMHIHPYKHEEKNTCTTCKIYTHARRACADNTRT